MSDGAAFPDGEALPLGKNPLMAAREAQRMTRQQLVDGVNTYICKRDGNNSAHLMTVGRLGKLERGESKVPRGALVQEALLHVLGRRSHAELGWPEPCSGATSVRDRSGLAAEPRADLDAILDEATSGVEQAASITEARTVSSTALHSYRSRLARLSVEFVHRPAEEVGPKLLALWKDVSMHVKGGLRQHQGREVYLVAGMICVVLAHLCHVRGRPHDGLVHAEAALLWAQDSGHRELLGWTLGTKALLTNSTEGAGAALQLIEEAKDTLRGSPRAGSGAVRLACYEARFSAESGQRDRGLAAIRASEDAAEALDTIGTSDLDVIGGILSLGEPKRASLCADPYLRLGHAELAEQHARAAIDGYLAGPPRQFSYGDVALSQVTVAWARLSAGELDGVLDAVRPVLALPYPQRIAPVRDQLDRLADVLSTRRFLGAAAAETIRTEITNFRRPSRAPLPM
ncbi:hypothetical protein [Lentzea flaviverrucosa]|uniref:Uncharacterized protein n=1 Tax=Lentzea flaviverrucosa TaxID=200379 RepID=A0A1H9EVJ0_9PSEU|nr:hypothetical protein [Lentzea flaviverrucosa]RDI35384.1 hypothetical protein DFR72_1011135 [Lentzea flaviverrucosa]SEQ29659.1 hypothetical protein SAMN05216195_10282 [Lentzea flaviverrucosa]